MLILYTYISIRLPPLKPVHLEGISYAAKEKEKLFPIGEFIILCEELTAEGQIYHNKFLREES